MTFQNKFNGIMSLSAATMALLAANSSKGNSADMEIRNLPKDADGGELLSKTSNLLLAPSLQEKLHALYLQHSSHSSHVSHSSHYSGAGGGGSDYYVAPTPYVPPAPVTVYPSTPQPRPAPVLPAPATNAAPQTNRTNTNAIAKTVPTKAEILESIKKRAAEGSANDQCLLGLFYLHGDYGVEANVEKAKMLFELAAIQGDATAKKHLAELQQQEKDAGTKQK
jgi:TPR repeat protein